MQLREPTRIGIVRHVLGSLVTVELDLDLAGIAPIWEGHLQPVGQIGSLVRIPQGPVTLLGTVTWSAYLSWWLLSLPVSPQR